MFYCKLLINYPFFVKIGIFMHSKCEFGKKKYTNTQQQQTQFSITTQHYTVGQRQLHNYYSFFQKCGLFASRLWKLPYHCCSTDEGTYVSPGWSELCVGSTAKELAKLTKFSRIFWPNSAKFSTVDACVSFAGTF